MYTVRSATAAEPTIGPPVLNVHFTCAPRAGPADSYTGARDVAVKRRLRQNSLRRDREEHDYNAWGFLLDIIHHRGQISTYLRPMGAAVPQICGPRADELI